MRVAILGGGPAGMTAAIYSARAGLKPVVIAPATGGQLMGKGVGVENYPGIMEANGGDIIKLMKSQAAKFSATFEHELGEQPAPPPAPSPPPCTISLPLHHQPPPSPSPSPLATQPLP